MNKRDVIRGVIPVTYLSEMVDMFTENFIDVFDDLDVEDKDKSYIIEKLLCDKEVLYIIEDNKLASFLVFTLGKTPFYIDECYLSVFTEKQKDHILDFFKTTFSIKPSNNVHIRFMCTNKDYKRRGLCEQMILYLEEITTNTHTSYTFNVLHNNVPCTTMLTKLRYNKVGGFYCNNYFNIYKKEV